MNEHEKRAFVFGAVKAMQDAGLLYKDASDGMVKLSQEYGFDPYAMYGYGHDQYGLDPGMYGGGYGRGGDVGTGPVGQMMGYAGQQEEAQPQAQPQPQPAAEPPQGGLSAAGGGGLGAAAGGAMGAGLGGLGGYYGASAINDLFGSDVDPQTLAAVLGLVGAAGGAGLGGYMGADKLKGVGGGAPPMPQMPQG